MRRHYFVYVLVALLCMGTESLLADQALLYKEIDLIGGYSDQRGIVDSGNMMTSSLGFEYYRKFSNDYGDFLTADLQMRLAFDSRESSDDAWGIEIHNAWLEYKLGSGKKIRLGHFDPAFGLEPVLDTHATLLKTLSEMSIGFTKDWGLAYKEIASWFDYEMAVQLGSGMSVHRRDDSFLATSRISTPSGANSQYGFSLLYGNVLQTRGMRTFPRNELLSDNAVVKKMIGFDAQHLWGPYQIKSEVHYGTHDRADVLGYLFEIDYTIPDHQNWELELQHKAFFNDLHRQGTDDSTLTFGVSYKLNQQVTLRFAFVHDINRMEGQEDDMVLFQWYFFGF